MHKTIWTVLVLGLGLAARAADTAGNAVRIASPDGKVVLQFATTADGGLQYGVSYQGKPVLLDSRLGFTLSDAPALETGFRVTTTSTATHDETWKPVAGERSSIRDHYNEIVVDLEDSQPSPRKLRLTFRAYNEGAALCYTFPEQAAKQFHIASESTEFRFTDDHRCWPVYSAQGVYANLPVSRVKPNCERPLVVEMPGGPLVAIGEARLVDFARMRLQPTTCRVYSLQAHLAGPATVSTPYTTPWRFVLIGESAGQLLERNYLVLNLNDPCALADTSWIKPGKVIREVTLTTVGGKACVDFAVKRGLQYVEFDAGWYGHEYDDKADARAVHVDPKRSKGPLDLREVIHYAGERGIGIILYVNRRALERQLDEILPLYRKWGVKGVKYGFVNVGSQQWTAWLHDAVRKAAAHKLVVDVHDEYRPTGYSRTYPNLLTQEGIAGDETSPTNSLTLTIAFTRMLAGAADNTVCYYDQRVTRNATHAYQLAKPVCLFSPLQFLFWYDRPAVSPRRIGGAGGAETSIGDDPELEFYSRLPTVWDDTRVLHGKIGEYAVIARRSGEEWFVGAMNSGQPRILDVPLDFLSPGTKYTAHVYSDDPQATTRTRVRIERQPADAKTVLKCSLTAQGGQAVWIEQAK
jgi:alpha-glucosidase